MCKSFGESTSVQATGQRVARREVGQFLVLFLDLGLGFLESIHHRLQLHVLLLYGGDIVQCYQYTFDLVIRSRDYRRRVDGVFDRFLVVGSQVELRTHDR